VPALLGAALVAGIMLLERRLDNGSDRLDDGSEAPTVALPIQHHPRGRA